MEKAITEVSSNPVTQEDIVTKVADLAAAEEAVQQLKADRAENEDTVNTATVHRTKKHEVHEKEWEEGSEAEGSMEGAITALGSKPVDGQEAAVLLHQRKVDVKPLPRAGSSSNKLSALGKHEMTAWLQGKAPRAQDPSMGEAAGILKTMEEEVEESVKVEHVEEEGEVVDYTGIKKAKKSEIRVAMEQMESKMKKVGSLKVKIATMQHDMENSGAALEENKKVLAALEKSCKDKAAERQERQKVRAEEQLALQDAIKMLSGDEALELFKKSLPSPSLIQLTDGSHQAARKEARHLLESVAHSFELHLSVALRQENRFLPSHQEDPPDDRPDESKNEQVDDDSNEDYCFNAFDEAEDKAKVLNKHIDKFLASVDATEHFIEQVAAEIVIIQEGVKELDASVAMATENRKSEHAEFEELIPSNSATVELLGMAKDRLQQFYRPNLAKTTTTTTTNEFDPYALVQVQSHSFEEPAEREPVGQPPTPGTKQEKGEESSNILHLLDLIVTDEMTIAKTGEANDQKEYEETVAAAKEKRAADTASMEEKVQAKADLEEDRNEDKDYLSAKKKELLANSEASASMHADCDWLLENFELRKQARVDETWSMKKAKAGLAGADSSLLQVASSSVRRLLRGQ